MIRFAAIAGNTSLDNIEKHGILADKNGFDQFLVNDHTNAFDLNRSACPELWVTLARVANVTSRVRIGPGVTDPYRRHPFVTAQAAATLDVSSNGRVFLGLGSSVPMHLEPLGIHWDKPLTRLREAVDLVRMLWNSAPTRPVNFQGECYSAKNAFLQVQPVQSKLEVYVAAMRPKTRKFAGQIADGWIPYLTMPDRYRVYLEQVKRGAEETGRNFAQVRRCVYLFTALVNKKRIIGRLLNSMRSVLVWEREILADFGYEIREPEDVYYRTAVVSEKSIRLRRLLARRVPLEVARGIAAIGPVNECIPKIEEYVRAGADTIIIRNIDPRPENTYRIFADRVMPSFR